MPKLRLAFLLFIISGSVLAQDHLAPLHGNPVLKKFWKDYAKTSHPPKKAKAKFIKTLPFLDDFSYSSHFPCDTMWQDSNVFINYTYPICPHTLGVATFDGVNKFGLPYNPGAAPNSSNPADTLTSQPIGLYSATPFQGAADSVYFSFYWQAGGLGSPPKEGDSLLLQFHYPGQRDSIFFPADSVYVPGDSIWTGGDGGPDSTWAPGYYTHTPPYVIVDTGFTTVWSHAGYTPSSTDTNFHYVQIPILWDYDSAYYKGDGFQFRFINYACTSGNVDHWNIDEVYINKFRSYQDTAQHDISFVYECQSMLANYEYMPWEQFTGLGDLKTGLTTFIRNNDYPGASPMNVLYTYDSIPNFMHSYTGGSINDVDFFDNNGYINYPPHTQAPLNFLPYTPLTGPTTYTFNERLHATGDFDTLNNILSFEQIFDKYYAYDDGTAECSYFINGYPGVPTQLAEQFTLNKPDTLIYMEVYFDYVFVNAKNYSFYFTVWDDNGGQPGNVIYRDTINSTITYPAYSKVYDDFMWYKLQTPVLLKSGPMWVGWTQTYGDSINIGFDLNDNHENQIEYNLDANAANPTWNLCSFPGSLMMRPVMGSPSAWAGINEVPNEYAGIKIYPNPANNIVNFSDELRDNNIKIFSEDGRLCKEEEHFSGKSISIATLPTGFYIVQLTSPEGKSAFQKLLISR
ncbi:MAG TPA: T9SS type A sorting domain-containing protein [Bacteroidia bacterium]|nr:T9SS type A sorting domain-containing protein [Bacteroidia bacterium]